VLKIGCMTRRELFKFLALLPLIGPAITKAMVKSDLKPALIRRPYPYLPEFFPKWDSAVDGLEEAGKWALEIERLRLPPAVVFPRVGQVWEAVRDCQVTFRPQGCRQPLWEKVQKGHAVLRARGWQLPIHEQAMFVMLGGTTQLRAGEKVRVVGLDHPEKPIHVFFQPLRYEELHAGIVPEEIRQRPGYAGYELSMKSAKTVIHSTFESLHGKYGLAFSKHAPQTFFNEAFRLVTDVA
jgi:hypothetical protein